MDQNPINLAETLARELKHPIEIASQELANVRRVALPPGWTIKEIDDEPLLEQPRRKKAKVSLLDAPSFIEYVNRHAMTESSLWATANYVKGEVCFTAIINDLGNHEEDSAWRDHTAIFTPKASEEWRRWVDKNRTPFTQADFASFIEDNVADVVEDGAGSPSGAQMLQMAISFEANQDRRFKSAIRLQSGGINMAFVESDDAQTIESMRMFERFSIGIPVFWGGEAYRIDARLRYRVKEGKLNFWYELIRSDKTLEAATKTVIEQITAGTGISLLFGNPFHG